MFDKILIANRGEIAVRIIRACKEMDIKTVAVYSEIDKEALHVKIADEAVCIGPANSKDSYLNMKNILEATCLTNAQAIHPGFGFLSENSMFAKVCEESNIKFIGPSADIIDMLGNKSNAKEIMKNAKVPVIPGSEGNVNSLGEALKIANEIKYPIMVKATSGGGGKGIRLIKNDDELIKNFELVKQEAKVSFNDENVYIEKFIENPRHVEVQILADEHGNVIELGERDCSVQRRNQKMIEESPSPFVNESTRKKLGEAAVNAAKAAKYTNAGTIEFLVDKNGDFYFMEMNTRIQVEHPVTECITDVDIVKEQIRIAYGEKLKYKQKDIEKRGHAMECRINAEDPDKNFMPSPGTIETLVIPGGMGVRIDSAMYTGYKIPPVYDSMVSKVIVHAATRQEAINKMKIALNEFQIEGIKTNKDFLLKILENNTFNEGEFDTSFVEKFVTNKL